MTDRDERRRRREVLAARPTDEPERDNDGGPITWDEIDADAEARPLRVRHRRRGRNVSDVEHFDPRRPA